MYPILPGLELPTCSVPSARRFQLWYSVLFVVVIIYSSSCCHHFQNNNDNDYNLVLAIDLWLQPCTVRQVDHKPSDVNWRMPAKIKLNVNITWLLHDVFHNENSAISITIEI